MKRIFFILIIIFSGYKTYPQNSIRVDTTLSVENLIRDKFLRGGIELENIKYSGNLGSIGLFTCPFDSFPLSNGILLSTGRAKDAMGPNNDFGMSSDNKTLGDFDLDRICKGTTYDACIIEFDFIPSSENLAFDFVFASEEYPEFVNSQFNDVFAFIISRTDSAEKNNIAYLPKTFEPITVNNVNHLNNSNYYIENPAAGAYYFINGSLTMATPQSFGTDKKGEKLKKANERNKIYTHCKSNMCKAIQFDGFTTMITTKKKVSPGKKYHFKIAIADVQDKIYDSGVILRAHSLKSYDKFGYIKGDTSGYIVKDEDLEKPELENKIPTVKTEKNYYFKPLLFDFDKALLTDIVLLELDSVVDVLKLYPQLSVHLYAHTDSMGSDDYNKLLSLKRGEAVKDKLLKSGIPLSRIKMDYYGEINPQALNNSETGRKLNRRVELLLK